MTDRQQSQPLNLEQAKAEALRRGWQEFEVEMPGGRIETILAPDAERAATIAKQRWEKRSNPGTSFAMQFVHNETAGQGDQFVTVETPTGAVRFPRGMSREEMAAALNQRQAAEHGSQPEEYRRLMDAAKEAHSKGNLELAKSLATQAVQVRQQQQKALAIAQARRKRAEAALTPEQRQDAQSNVGDAGGMSGAALDGFMFNYGDEYLAGLSSVLGVQPDGQGGANWFDYSEPIGQRYDTALEAIRQEQAGYAKENPAKSVTAEIVGALLGPGKGGAGFVNAGKGTLGRMARGGAVGGAAGAGFGFGDGEGGFENRALESLASAPLGALGGGALVGVGQGFSRALNAIKARRGGGEAVPTLEGLRETAKGLYERARELGGELPEQDVKALAARVAESVRDAGFDRQLHPRVAAVIDRLAGETGPKSLGELEVLRRVARNAAQSLQPDERRIAAQVVDRIDDAVEGMGAGSPALKEARDAWRRVKRMEIVEGAVERAALQDNFAAGLRTQFRGLLRNPKRLRGFSEADIKAIRRVATGTASVKALRALSGLTDPRSLVGMALAGTTAFAGPGLGPAMGVAAAGMGTRSVVDALVKGSARKALSQVGRSEAQSAVIEALMKHPNPAAPAAAVPGLIGGLLMEDPR